MPPRKGLATTKKVNKYIYVNSDGEEVSPPESPLEKTGSLKLSNPLKAKRTPPKQPFVDKWPLADSDKGDADLANLRGIPKHSNPHQPCQASQSVHSDQLQQSTLAESLFPPKEDQRTPGQTASVDLNKLATPHHADSRKRDSFLESPPRQRNAHPDRRIAEPTQTPQRPARIRKPRSSLSTPSRQNLIPSGAPIEEAFASMSTNMIPGGAFVPPNQQQRNLRACMVCSIVRTEAQFKNGGCPNCEDFLELANNSNNIEDCTSSVFEGCITVADTSRSWVARFQRLEGYVAGVYATQVEGILPEEIVSAVEAAGIHYIPRDGSEDQMLPKD
ncbi:hypothetical protein E8E13_008089 [Curvularia kusanoi]|uniref:Transcription elongation factor SPT4 n=1 Tax=Curvularia kusanoi TaxID=90978 RepID=A0A9P4TD37_CURKU|nr:hypothetical protein E8E13_008089 [Curvularia kusanoi]